MNAPSAISDRELHLWFLDLGGDHPLADSWAGLLDEDEHQRCERLMVESAQRQLVRSHGLTRWVLARYLGCDPRSLTFERGERGRPELTGGPAECGLRFNLSHTAGLAVLGVARGVAVGVDVERVRSVTDGVPERHFAPAEVQSLQGLDADDWRARFFAFWTLKEAYIKARGLGLALPLRRFAFELDFATGHLGFSADKDIEAAAQDWRFALLQPFPGFRAAWALERSAGTVAQRGWHVQPDGTIQALDLSILASGPTPNPKTTAHER